MSYQEVNTTHMIRRFQLCPTPPHYDHYITLLGGVIKNIKLSSHIAVIKIRPDKRHLYQCPFCEQKMGENRRLWQVAKDLLLGTAHLVEIIYEAIQGYCSNCKRYSVRNC